MSATWSTLVSVAAHSAEWSLLAIGGMNATMADIHRYTVETRHWVTNQQFVTFYSITQAAPGPNGMAIALIGFEAAGLAGLLIATLAKILPPTLLAYFASGWVERHEDSRIVNAIRRGLAPVTVGLLAAAAYVFARETDINPVRVLATLVTVVIVNQTKLNPIWLVILGGVLGLAGIMR